MKVHILNQSNQKLGGGFGFLNTLLKEIPEVPYEQAEVCLVPSASMIKPELAQQAKRDGKKVVLRVDNFLKHSRNRGRGMSRMKAISHVADTLVFQSKWARDFLSPYLSKTGPIILNGIDLNMFPEKKTNKNRTFLYAAYSTDQSKNWIAAQYYFMREWNARTEDIELLLVGKFDRAVRENNFDFFNGENVNYLGIVPAEAMPAVYAKADKFLYTYMWDACSNTLIEALASGLEIPHYCQYFLSTGGAREIMAKWHTEGREYFSHKRMCNQYEEVLSE